MLDNKDDNNDISKKIFFIILIILILLVFGRYLLLIFGMTFLLALFGVFWPFALCAFAFLMVVVLIIEKLFLSNTGKSEKSSSDYNLEEKADDVIKLDYEQEENVGDFINKDDNNNYFSPKIIIVGLVGIVIMFIIYYFFLRIN